MTNASRQLPHHGSNHRTAATIVAAILILIGLFFQLETLSYARTSMGSFWYIAVILKTVCSMAAACLNTPLLRDAFLFWPLALVTAGAAMLLSGKRAAGSGAADGDDNA